MKENLTVLKLGWAAVRSVAWMFVQSHFSDQTTRRYLGTLMEASLFPILRAKFIRKTMKSWILLVLEERICFLRLDKVGSKCLFSHLKYIKNPSNPKFISTKLEQKFSESTCWIQLQTGLKTAQDWKIQPWPKLTCQMAKRFYWTMSLTYWLQSLSKAKPTSAISLNPLGHYRFEIKVNTILLRWFVKEKTQCFLKIHSLRLIWWQTKAKFTHQRPENCSLISIWTMQLLVRYQKMFWLLLTLRVSYSCYILRKFLTMCKCREERSQ